MRVALRRALLATSLVLTSVALTGAGSGAFGPDRARAGPDPEPVRCGSPAQVCPAPAHGRATCSAGRCGVACDAGYTLCGDRCVSLRSDALHCGACGHVCPGEDPQPGGYCDQAPQRACVDGQCKKCRWFCGGYGGYYRVCSP